MKYAITLATLLLSGCCFQGNSPAYITYYLHRGFVGHPVNQFFNKYGFPEGAFETAGNGRVYKWSSLQPIPPNANRYSYDYPDGHYVQADNYRGGIERQYCELRIATDTNDVVRDITIAVDSTGRWSTSRCSELFDKIY